MDTGVITVGITWLLCLVGIAYFVLKHIGSNDDTFVRKDEGIIDDFYSGTKR